MVPIQAICQDCDNILRSPEVKSLPHAFLREYHTESKKIIGQSRYTSSQYECEKCGNKLLFEEDKNDRIHWSLLKS